MTDILVSDILLLESQELSDFDTGGGPANYSRIVPDNEVRNLFAARFSLDEIIGNVQLRKAYAAIGSLNQALAGGVRLLLTKPPTDELMSALLFTTEDWADYHPEMTTYIESQLDDAAIHNGILLYDHIEGSTTLQLHYPTGITPAAAGTRLALALEGGGYDYDRQVIRIASVIIQQEQTFVYNGTETFVRNVVTFEISPPLNRDWPGEYPKFGQSTSPTVVRDTTPNQRARFYGVAPLTVAANQGDNLITVDSIYRPIVPTSYSELPVVGAIAGQRTVNLLQAGTTDMSVSRSLSLQSGQSTALFFPQPLFPGSVEMVFAGVTYVDWTDASIRLQSGQLGTIRGLVNHAGRNITISPAVSVSGTITATALPAAAYEDSCATAYVPIDIDTIGINYPFALKPPPAPGTLVVDYYSAGTGWARITDAGGQGVFSGDGTGAVDYVSGQGLVSLAREPAAGSWLIYSWGAASQTNNRSGQVIAIPYIQRTITGLPGTETIKPGTISWAWTSNSVAKTATANSAGVISGDATGSVEYSRNTYLLRPTLLPDPDTLTSTFDTVSTTTEFLTIADVDHVVSGTLAAASIAGSVTLQFTVSRYLGSNLVNNTITLYDGADGKLYFFPLSGAPIERGTINNATGAFTATVETTYVGYSYAPHTITTNAAGNLVVGNGAWTQTAPYETYSGSITAKYHTTGTAQQTDITDAIVIASLSVAVSPNYKEPLIPSSLQFTLAGKTWSDQVGVLYYDVDPISGAGTIAGSLDHLSGIATLTAWPAGGLTAINVTALNTKKGDWSVTQHFFRTPGAPIRPGTLYIQATETDGDVINATADNNGDITGTGFAANCAVDQSLGMVALYFTNPVKPNTITQNCTVLRLSSLDPDLIGLDPTQLPLDGRVQAFRADNVAAIHETFSGAIAANPPVGGSTITTGYTDLHLAYVVDVNDDKVPITEYTVDLALGTITFVANPNFTGLTGPYSWVARIMDEKRIERVYSNGQIELGGALSRDYSTDAFVSSELVVDYLQARIAQVINLHTWNNDFDERTGAPPSSGALLNLASYPATLTNRHALHGWYAIKFDASDRVDVRHESRGVLVADHLISGDLVIPNPDTSQPALTIPNEAFGVGGWVTGNTILIRVESATYPVDFALCCLPGEHTIEDLDSVTLEIMVDVEPD